uniref:Uncharacterized protein n=1 Tax=Echeneis naucrates TaxID=173247 RepID=A0A665V8M8_ECHNA
MAYPEVIRIHMQLLRVHHAQLGVGALDVVHVLHGIFQPTHHCLSMCGHFRVSHDGKVSLSPGVHNQKPEKIQKNTSPGQGLGSNFTHIYLPPQGTDGLLRDDWLFIWTLSFLSIIGAPPLSPPAL